MVGVRTDSAGYLREPFALIPIGYLTGTAALVTGCAHHHPQAEGQLIDDPPPLPR
ncbi:DUF3955 domain-containing protein [Vulcanococcus sp.]|uniref:DUF3955 domain-containing protein n=1 Tax=Vulcanococcus sp. TaxID=2856995 RepID=UPI003F6989C6